eukprot:PLAT11658.1.p2 GENE.PLAT11658.1~~PLAT11658.1.p2  ORF type:complete len:219 (+),score=98.18 PLAT11658.1:59-715(+)
MPKTFRKREIARGLTRFSAGRNRSRHQTAKKAAKRVAKPAEESKEAASKWYPADDVPVKRGSCHGKQKPTKLRASISPGSVLILLAGRFAGKRVVFLKQLPSGLLLVSGPFAINGVPLRRVNQAYVIATSTTVDISGVDVPAHIDDAYFARPKGRGSREVFTLDSKVEAREIDAGRIEDQKTVDGALTAAVEAEPLMKEYLKSRFSLAAGEAPHTMVF